MVTSIANARLALTRRPRRLRRTEAIRTLVRETRLTPDCFILPLFVCEGRGVRREVASMPGVFQLSVDEAVAEAAAAKADGVPGVLLFGLPESKDATGSKASDPEAPVQQAVRALKREVPDLIVITDVCLCEYTSHGHCGILDGEDILNDVTVAHVAEAALSHAIAGADFVAPSDMMDGRVAAIRSRARRARDSSGSASCRTRRNTARRSTGPSVTPLIRRRSSATAAATRWTPPTWPRALREVETDLEEGADIVMVKPALHYLDVISRVKMQFGQPTAAYHVSGEYAMLKLAVARGWIDERRAMLETLTAIKRAGADIIITYYARDAARIL